MDGALTPRGTVRGVADRSRCPNCGERVSPWAAGCAVCGADLDPHRWDSGPSLRTRVSSALNAVSFGAVPLWVIALLLVALVVAFSR